MKKFVCMLLTVLMILSISSVCFGEQNETEVFFDGEKLMLEQGALIEDGVMLVPMRAIFEKLGYKVDYYEFADGKFVTANKGSAYMYTTIGSNVFCKNNLEIDTDTPAKIINGKTMMPLTMVAESSDAIVDWDKNNNCVYIESFRGLHNIVSGYLSDELKDENGNIIVKSKAVYPIIENTEENAFIDRINEEYKNEAENYVRGTLKLVEEFEGYDFEAMDCRAMEFDLSYDVNTDRMGFASITNVMYEDTLGAHPNTVKKSRTFDLKNEKELFIADILTDTAEELKEDMSRGFAEYFRDGETDEEYIAMMAENVKEEAENVSFYLTDDAIVLYFQVYQIAPYAAGYPEYKIPYDSNAERFKTDLYGAGCTSITINLKGNPTTGYTWFRADEGEAADVNMVYEADATDGDVVGSGGTYRFDITPVKPGYCDVELWYARAWESSMPNKSVTYKLRVASDMKITLLGTE